MRQELEIVCKLRGTNVGSDSDHLNTVIDDAMSKVIGAALSSPGPPTASTARAPPSPPRVLSPGERKFGIILKSAESATLLDKLDLPGPRGATPLIMLATLGNTAVLQALLGTYVE